MTELPSYSFIDYGEWDQDCGGPAPEYTFDIIGDTLNVIVEGIDSYDTPDPPDTCEEAIDILSERRKALAEDLANLDEFLIATEAITKYNNFKEEESK